MTPEEHYAEAERLAKFAADCWLNPEGDYEPTTDLAELKIRQEIAADARADAMVILALAQVHATLALYRPTPQWHVKLAPNPTGPEGTDR